MRKQLNTKENFINVMVDCYGYGEEDAIELAKAYHNNLETWIIRCEGDGMTIEECREFCGI